MHRGRNSIAGRLLTVTIFAVLCVLESSYLGWDYSDPETAVLGAAFHSFEWLFVRAAPFFLWDAIIGIIFTGRKG